MVPDTHNILSAQMFTLSDRMFVNSDTLASLQILRSELHPNSQIQSSDTLPSGFKENLSVFGLFKHLACTPQGKAKLRQMFLQPTTDLRVIRDRQREVSVFALAENEGTVRDVQRCLRKMQDMRKVVSRLERGAKSTIFHASADYGLWRTLQKFSIHAISMRECLSRLSFPGGVAGSVQRVMSQACKRDRQIVD